MCFLREAVGVTRRDRIRNEEIREICNVGMSLEKLEWKQLLWFGHIVRMNYGRMVKKIWKVARDKKMRRGRPTKT